MRVLVCSVSVFVYHSFARGASCKVYSEPVELSEGEDAK